MGSKLMLKVKKLLNLRGILKLGLIIVRCGYKVGRVMVLYFFVGKEKEYFGSKVIIWRIFRFN